MVLAGQGVIPEKRSYKIPVVIIDIDIKRNRVWDFIVQRRHVLLPIAVGREKRFGDVKICDTGNAIPGDTLSIPC